ncbi:MAG: CDP-diacylglycerol--serine O-phosphatidyltransferase [Bacteroidetes bacterium]|nr:CDP-diacylglycerol--serine O-phosphatidyltransferase [Bacteroidota bacterium]
MDTYQHVQFNLLCQSILMNLRRHIPNSITLCNLLLGSLSIIFSLKMDVPMAGVLILLATIPDFLDGLAARMLKVTSDIGKDLDSLADMVSFGLAPAILYYQIGEFHSVGPAKYIVVILPLFAAIRLAKFNNDDRQSEEFYGLPTPSVAIFLAAFPFFIEFDHSMKASMLSNVWIYSSIPVLLSVLMVSEIKLFSLKFKSLSLGENVYRYLLISGAIILFVLLRWTGIPLIILFYILLSLIRNFVR